MKAISFITGFTLLVLLAILLVANFGNASFTIHMIIHMGTVAFAAPLIAHALTGSTYREKMPLVGRLTPMPASLIELVVVWFWHLPAIRATADASFILSVSEQISFLAAGLLLWFACLQPKEGRIAGAMGLLFTSMHMTLLGVLIALAPRPLYGGDDVTCFGIPLSAVSDQQMGGVFMLVAGAFSYLVGGLVLVAGLLREDQRPTPVEKP
ncbi:cytochrome c oxidase assembly protein [Rhizobium pusense]|uniref:cytochrome c oxidase assembly protein n=1 Tax=Agrobacterium pusense TaxID=648995 RepID=UPI001F258E02|nr:cytochrome c oxidase assembly protein [Agrobacterium pusense]MDH0911747.1 cytochrome c oxidase assembly protein [Agrobacterium pusense]MDH1097818.1 cytochrome c oxidase assembly protein [Agrobacterium pusense]MDH1114239.1 cytochrome c oxidase assembly protein [Agrobacterium pusense]MDH2196383.1 cytochrome c oxidase assembly protein [Agrobacterium pusense]